jgi:hypothetical protein
VGGKSGWQEWVARVGGGSEGSSRVTSCVVKTKVVSSEINKSRWEAADGRPMDAYGRLWTPMDADGRTSVARVVRKRKHA